MRFNGATDLYRWKRGQDWTGGDGIGRASMGPPIYIGGNHPASSCDWDRPRASMGPPIYIGGNGEHQELVPLPRVRFNGATDLYRWKLPHDRAHAHAQQSASMGPPIYIGGNGIQGGTSFNSVVASMGPPIYIGGN